MDHDATKKNGDKVQVVYVTKSNAKTLKTALEQHNWIHKNFRMAPAVVNMNWLAIPVVEDYYCVVVNADSDSNNMNNNQTECWRDLVMGNGIQYCPYSTSVLGNPQKRHAQDNTRSTNNSNGD